ncbi:polysaccharide biosynthesis protein [Mesorhizobium sp. RP14(2022)]|uniref:Polysaccharide biosynthesis protein n=1 Tax=Mesorhizobium liriopis TaxID=2953882 RepID=A0ABT1C5S3_9HYPH|nr:polysaccharide biosynthesis protein [Mesorhizobium liriopis]MCO6050170.1 polysaccharide biosynthesis protein [Mesorhizobium liriopis]
MTIPTSPLHAIATGRDGSMFEADIAARAVEVAEAVGGRRILAVGGAGSIGSSTVLQLARRRPDALHIIDQNENGLAELVRQLRSQPQTWSARDFQTLPIDYGSGAMRHFLASQKPYDLVLNFAALKHVRSEKDPFSTLQMFETNLVKQARFMGWLAETGFAGRLFTVSTDKAANPSSMMGASKRVMEHILFNSSVAATLQGPKTSARFANVAFSNGSLLQGFENRFARGEPLAAPLDTRRYFVSLQESGELCALAATIAPDQAVVIPKLNPEDHLVLLHEIAEKFLRRHGFEPAAYTDEASACANVAAERMKGRWPLLLTALDTAGEKPYEEFTTAEETTFEIGLPNLRAVRYAPAERRAIDDAIRLASDMLNARSDEGLDKGHLKQLIAAVEPRFLQTHRDAAANLDQRL